MGIETLLAQLGGNGDIFSTVIWFLMFFVFIFLYPKLMVTQTIWKLEKDIKELERLAKDTELRVAKKIESRPSAKLKESVSSFMDFFAVEPVSTDPYGVIKKIDMVIRQSERRFRWFVDQIAPGLSETEKKNIKGGLAGAMTAHQIAKVLRHLLELIKKYKILQLAMVLQMQLPLIARMAKAASAATRAFVNQIPIGDGIGPMVAANLIPAKAKVKKYENERFVVSKVKIGRRQVYVAKADGPGSDIGRPGRFLQKFIKRRKIDRIITVDAAMRLQGEKTGSIAEGVGVAMGGTVDRYQIEEIAVKKNIPLDAIGIKVSDKEALEAMKKEVLDAMPQATKKVREALKRAGKKEKILIMGVGNTCGIGNRNADYEETRKRLLGFLKKLKKAKEKKK